MSPALSVHFLRSASASWSLRPVMVSSPRRNCGPSSTVTSNTSRRVASSGWGAIVDAKRDAHAGTSVGCRPERRDRLAELGPPVAALLVHRPKRAVGELRQIQPRVVAARELRRRLDELAL